MRSVGSIRWEVVANLVSLLWRPLLDALSALLARSSAEPLLLPLLRAYQGFTYCAGALRVPKARDGFLAALCAHTLLAPDDPAWLQAEQSAASTTGAWRSYGGMHHTLQASRARLLGCSSVMHET